MLQNLLFDQKAPVTIEDTEKLSFFFEFSHNEMTTYTHTLLLFLCIYCCVTMMVEDCSSRPPVSVIIYFLLREHDCHYFSIHLCFLIVPPLIHSLAIKLYDLISPSSF